MIKNFIMLLTFSRIFLGPLIFILSVFLEMYLASLIIFIICSLSDFFDGYLARKFSQESSLGKLLDPIADKILLCSCLISILEITQDKFIGLMILVILIREFWVSALREFNSIKGRNSLNNVTFLAKIKTTIQFIAIASYYYSFYLESSLAIFISSFILFLGVIITVKTGMEYTKNSSLSS